LTGIYPNPFRQHCSLELELAKACRIKLCIYDIRGRRVAILKNEQLPAGAHQLPWQAVDASGRALPSGVYILRMDAGPEVFIRKLMLLK
ncbi:MAG TPA: T9SS type A sorting domain-containing protein, partial [Candidatus Cloacimonadota bacterium]|nr:T9SS type A sorting domain-containing protein [Candidatus Cloacimonadota bacterium]